MFQRTVALTANQNSRDILTQILGFPYVADRAAGLNIAFNASATADVVFGVQIGTGGGRLLTVVDEMQPIQRAAFGINPDDFVLGLVPVLPGQQLLLPVREVNGNTPSIFITIVPTYV